MRSQLIYGLKIMIKAKTINVLSLSVVLAACASPATQKATDSYSMNEQLVQVQKNIEAQDRAAAAMADNTYQRVAGIYLGAKSVSIRNDILLPDVFFQPKVFSASGTMTLAQAAAEISAKSGISIRLASDVMPTGAQQQGTPPGLSGITLNSTTSTKNILDQLTSDAGLSWAWNNNSGTATIQRTITESFRLKASLGDTNIVSNTGASNTSTAQGASGGGITSGFSTNVNVVNVTRINPLISINDAVKTVLSKTGTTVTTVTNSIIVTDNAEGVDRARKLIEREDEILSRNANIRVQIFSFTANEADSANFNIMALYQNISKFGFGFSSPTSISTTGGASFSANVLSGIGKPGHTDGSKVFADLLAQKGKVAIVHDINVPITNLNLYSMSIPRQIAYLKQSTPTAGTIAGQAPGTPGLETEKITYGFKMSMLGNILDSNNMRLKFNIGILDLLELRKIDSGTGVNLQSPDMAGFELPADLALKPGQTVIVTGFEHVTNNYNRAGLSQDIPLLLGGGSYNAKTQSERYYILVTPTISPNTQ